MPRRPDGPSARTESVTVRLTPSQAHTLDAKRGAISRSEFIRRLIVGRVSPMKEATDARPEHRPLPF